jgi:3-isopropylmalate/(R)-2-methylmalate dehydratase small subunit
MTKRFEGKVIKYGNDINTDLIIPTRFCNSTDLDYLGSHCLYNLDPDFVQTVRQGDILMAGENFGCGSSRENAPLAIKGAKVSCVIAGSFARIFFRNAINIGLPIIENRKMVDETENGDRLLIDFEENRCRNLTRNREYLLNNYPTLIHRIFEEGGLIDYIKNS